MAHKCPECASQLSELSPEQMMYVCENCGCRSLNLARLKELLSPIASKRMNAGLAKVTPSEKRHCITCGTAFQLADVKLGPQTSVEIDICQKCGLVWFDMGELEEFISIDSGHADLMLPNEIRDRIFDLDRDQDGKVVPHNKAFRFDSADFKVSTLGRSELKPKWWQWAGAFFGMPVERENSIVGKPVVTWSLIAITTVVSLLSFFVGDQWILRFGYYSHAPFLNNGFNGLASFFLHAGWAHLIGNMYFLGLFGDNAEDDLGHFNFALMLALATAAGHLLYSIVFPRAYIPLIGASGGISGVAVYYALRFPRNSLSIIQGLFFWVRMPAYAYFLIWGILQVVGVEKQIFGLTRVSYLSHAGGALVGAAFAFLARKKMLSKAAGSTR